MYYVFINKTLTNASWMFSNKVAEVLQDFYTPLYVGLNLGLKRKGAMVGHIYKTQRAK